MKRKRFICILGALSLITMTISAILALWTARTEAFAHYRPEYAQIDLLPILQKDELTEEDYSLLFSQTGLAEAGINQLWAAGQQEVLLYLQERYFAETEIECLHNNLFIRSERLIKDKTAFSASRPKRSLAPEPYEAFPAVQPGDILITFSGHVFGWRSGHAAIVIDAEKSLTLEAITIGCDSRICPLADWEEYPSVALFRLKDASLQEREQIAAYAKEYLQGLPYSVTAFTIYDDSMDKTPSQAVGISALSGALGQALGCGMSFESTRTKIQKAGSDTSQIPEEPQPLAGTQCAHLVWYAYRSFGYDLDSDGGFIVTPDDLYHSELLELVQIYGIPSNY